MQKHAQKTMRAWDLPTRLFHWLLVLLIANAWVSFQYSDVFGDTFLMWHRYSGYAVIVLLVWRVLWGIAGSRTSRFTQFVTWPWRAAGYAVDLVRGRDRHFLGHNPLGTYMILALLVAVAFQTMLGMLSTEHNFVTWGPLSHLVSSSQGEEITELHGWFYYNVLLVLIGIHVTANVLYGLVKKDPLIRAMITGRKPALEYEDQPADGEVGDAVPRPNAMLRAGICLVLAIVIVFGAIKLLGGKLFY